MKKVTTGQQQRRRAQAVHPRRRHARRRERSRAAVDVRDAGPAGDVDVVCVVVVVVVALDQVSSGRRWSCRGRVRRARRVRVGVPVVVSFVLACCLMRVCLSVVCVMSCMS